jgi:hypothetical protein
MNSIKFWLAPASTGLLALIFYGPFGFGRDFGAFIIGLLWIVPALGIALFVGLVFLTVGWRSQHRSKICSLAIATLVPLVLIPVLWFFGDPLRDPARFAVWSQLHSRQLDAATTKSGIISHWDSWGWAGSGENDSYLASDPQDTLAQDGAASRWAKSQRLGCDIVGVQRMRRAVYIVTTYNCTIDGI